MLFSINHDIIGVLSVPDKVQIAWIGKTEATIKWRKSLYPEQTLHIAKYIIILHQGLHWIEFLHTDPLGGDSKYEHKFQNLLPCTIYSFEIVPVDHTGMRLEPTTAKFQTKGGQKISNCAL